MNEKLNDILENCANKMRAIINSYVENHVNDITALTSFLNSTYLTSLTELQFEIQKIDN